MARPPRLERGTLCLEGRCSIQLSYGRTKAYFARIPNHGKRIRQPLRHTHPTARHAWRPAVRRGSWSGRRRGLFASQASGDLLVPCRQVERRAGQALNKLLQDTKGFPRLIHKGRMSGTLKDDQARAGKTSREPGKHPRNLSGFSRVWHSLPVIPWGHFRSLPRLSTWPLCRTVYSA